MSEHATLANLTPRLQEMTALLRAVIDELHLLTFEFVQLGERLSEDFRTCKNTSVDRLQAFDVLAQRALAGVAMLRGLERGLTGDEFALADLVAAVPFHDARTRIVARMLEKSILVDCESVASSDVDWF